MDFSFFFFNDTATTEIYTLSLHDALPISERGERRGARRSSLLPAVNGSSRIGRHHPGVVLRLQRRRGRRDRKSTRLNSSHANISYAVFCLKKKKTYNLTLFLLSSYYTHHT